MDSPRTPRGHAACDGCSEIRGRALIRIENEGTLSSARLLLPVRVMYTAALFLIAIGCLGTFDIVHFHRRARLADRPESRIEAAIHVARGVIYALQFIVVSHVRFYGAAYALFLALYVADVAIAFADVCVEPRTRASQGGLSPGEYVAHIALSVLIGAYLHALVVASWSWPHQATRVQWVSHDFPSVVRIALESMAAGCVVNTLIEFFQLLDRWIGAPRPLHVAVRLRCKLEQLWSFTQDHRRHPEWDHRFSRIVMLSDRIDTGTCMRYEKRVLGLTIRGYGRYKLHRPMRQSTFEFWSDDPRSLIRRGVGLWLYRDVGNGNVEFSTAYTYETRWGLAGRYLDRFLFRPAFQWFTEQSFRRLARQYFPTDASRVVGAVGRKPARLPALEAA